MVLHLFRGCQPTWMHGSQSTQLCWLSSPQGGPTVKVSFPWPPLGHEGGGQSPSMVSRRKPHTQVFSSGLCMHLLICTMSPPGIPYSEHSSFSELRQFVQFLRPKKIIPTVNNHSASKRAEMQRHFQTWLSESGSSVPAVKQTTLDCSFSMS